MGRPRGGDFVSGGVVSPRFFVLGGFVVVPPEVEGSMPPTRPKIRQEAESRLQDLGIDLVSMDWAGSRNRPVIRLRIERSPMGDPPVTVNDLSLIHI